MESKKVKNKKLATTATSSKLFKKVFDYRPNKLKARSAVDAIGFKYNAGYRSVLSIVR